MKTSTLLKVLSLCALFVIVSTTIPWFIIKSEKESKESQEPLVPVWIKTVYYRDHEGLCFVRVIDNSKMGISFIPEDRCPLKEEPYGPVDYKDHVQQDTSLSNLRW